MSSFEAPRGTGRLLELGRSSFIDLPHLLDKEPDQPQPQLGYQRSESGAVETQPGSPYDRVTLAIDGVTAELRDRMNLLYYRTLLTGGQVEFRRDATRYFHLGGDSEVDSRQRQRPMDGWSATQQALGGRYGQGGLFVSPADPASWSRTNLAPNGDIGDGLTGWVVDTPATLSLAESLYMRPNGVLGSLAKFSALGTGTKTAHIDLPLTPKTVNDLGLVTLSSLARADAAPGSVYSGLLDFDFIPTTGTPFTAQQSYSGQPTTDWQRIQHTVDLTALTASDTAVRVRATFSDDLAAAPVYLTELQVEPRGFFSGFIPYSTVRTTLTGSRAAGLLSYSNGLAYFSQLYAWVNNLRWGFVVAFDFMPGWSGSSIPAATMYLYNDADGGLLGSVPALEIKATATTIVAKFFLQDRSQVTLTATGITWVAGTPVHILATFRDWDGSTGLSGSCALYVNGVAAASGTHSLRGARQGERFWLGTRPDGSVQAAGAFSSVQIDPVFVDNATARYLVSDYYNASVMPHRVRNGGRYILDPAQKGEPVKLEANSNNLDLLLLEAR